MFAPFADYKKDSVQANNWMYKSKKCSTQIYEK